MMRFFYPLFLLFALFFILFPAFPQHEIAHAQESGGGGPSLTVIRDVEIEKYLHDMANPIFIAAGLNPNSVRIVIVRDPTLNAYVAGGQNIFLHTALIQATDNARQLYGVMAHE